MDNEVLKALRERRSIRSFKADQITVEELQTVLESGTWAPLEKDYKVPILWRFKTQNSWNGCVKRMQS